MIKNIFWSLFIILSFISCSEDYEVDDELENGVVIGSVTDIDGNTYKTTAIGDQIWMAENIRVTKYADGGTIPKIEDNNSWAILEENNDDGAYCFYNNNENGESDTYGALYTFAVCI